jgi:hypothetical protein
LKTDFDALDSSWFVLIWVEAEPGGRDFCRKSAHKLILASRASASLRHRERGCRLQLLQQSPEFSLKFQVTHNYRWWITAGPMNGAALTTSARNFAANFLQMQQTDGRV